MRVRDANLVADHDLSSRVKARGCVPDYPRNAIDAQRNMQKDIASNALV